MTLSRRDFVAGSARAALAAPGLAWLNGCGRRKDGAPPAGSDSLGPMEGELSIYNWSDYISPEVIAGFEREFGIRVTYDTYESSEELVAKLQAGATGYDLVVPSTYSVTPLIASGLLAPLTPRYLQGLDQIAPAFRGLPHDPDNTFTVPWQWGMTGIAWRTDLVRDPPESWSVFLDRTRAGRLTMLDDLRDVLGAFLRYRGHSINSVDRSELDQAGRDARAAKQNLKAYLSAPVKGQLIAGDVWVAQLWNGDAAQARREQPALSWILPEEGGTLWIDSLAIPRSAPHPRAAHAFIEYTLRPANAAKISAATGYGSPNQGAMSLIPDPVPYPSEAELSRLEVQRDLGPAMELWDRIWTEVKTA